eukprot:4793687-Amphidinium_carterae.1
MCIALAAEQWLSQGSLSCTTLRHYTRRSGLERIRTEKILPNTQKKFQELEYTPNYWNIEEKGVYQWFLSYTCSKTFVVS